MFAWLVRQEAEAEPKPPLQTTQTNYTNAHINPASQTTTHNNNNNTNQQAGLSKQQLESLQLENEKLKQLVEQLTQQAQQSSSSSSSSSPVSSLSFHKLHVGSGSSPAQLYPQLKKQGINKADIAVVNDFYAQLKSQLDQSQKKSPAPSSTTSPTTMSIDNPKSKCLEEEWEMESGELSERPITLHGTHLPEDEAVVHHAKASVIVNKKPLNLHDDAQIDSSSLTGDDDFGFEGNEDADEEIGIVDLEAVEWWTVVPSPDRPDEELKSAPVVDDTNEEGFVVVRNKDASQALADFIAATLQRHPEVMEKLSPEQVKKMLDGTFSELKQPTTMGQMWNYGKLMYQSYGWGATAWSLYKDQTMIRLVATGVIKGLTWVCVFLV